MSQQDSSKKSWRVSLPFNCLVLSLALGLIWPGSATARGLTVEMLKNTTCSVCGEMVTILATGKTIYPIRKFKLRNGRCSHAEGFKFKLKDTVENTAIGDLDGDGIADGALIFGINTGGTGYSMYMCVFLDRAGKPVQVGYRSLGDRSRARSLTIKDKIITVDILERGADDTTADPTMHKISKFTVKGKKLVGPPEFDSCPR
jgi:hypothetical protein